MDELAKLYQAWLTRNNLPQWSADEVICLDDLTHEQVKFLEAFIHVWDNIEN